MARVEPGVERTFGQQRDWYGLPLGEVFEGLCRSLGVSQAALARLLGLSPAMVSQLRNGQRAKIANPAAAHRLSRLMELADRVDAGGLDAQEALHEAEQVRADTTAFSRPGSGTEQTSISTREVLRSLAAPEVLARLAAQAEPDAPALARLLREAATG